MRVAAAAFALAFLLLGIFTCCDARPQRPSTLAQAASGRRELSTLTTGLLTYPAAFQALITSNTTAATVFAPTNKAFEALFKKLNLTSWPAANSSLAPLIISVLRYHVVPAVAFRKDVKHNLTVPTLLSGSTLTLDTKAVDDGGIVVRGRVTDALVLTTDIRAGLSVIHTINDVLLPSNPFPVPFTSIADAAQKAGLSSLVAALTRANLVATVANPDLVATVYAPTNKAFERFLKDNKFKSLNEVNVTVLTKVLLYHVTLEYRTTGNMLANQHVATLFTPQTLEFKYRNRDEDKQTPVTIQAARSKAKIVAPDVFAGAGVVHVVDTVLVPRL